MIYQDASSFVWRIAGKESRIDFCLVHPPKYNRVTYNLIELYKQKEITKKECDILGQMIDTLYDNGILW